jgi:hypothetical protein
MKNIPLEILLAYSTRNNPLFDLLSDFRVTLSGSVPKTFFQKFAGALSLDAL